MMRALSGPAVRALDISEEGQALLALLFPQMAGLKVDRVEDTGDAVVISASCTVYVPKTLSRRLTWCLVVDEGRSG
jgi:hypothetical protein